MAVPNCKTLFHRALVWGGGQMSRVLSFIAFSEENLEETRGAGPAFFFQCIQPYT